MELARLVEENLIQVQMQEKIQTLIKKNAELQQQLETCTQQMQTTERTNRQLLQEIRQKVLRVYNYKFKVHSFQI